MLIQGLPFGNVKIFWRIRKNISSTLIILVRTKKSKTEILICNAGHFCLGHTLRAKILIRNFFDIVPLLVAVWMSTYSDWTNINMLQCNEPHWSNISQGHCTLLLQIQFTIWKWFCVFYRTLFCIFAWWNVLSEKIIIKYVAHFGSIWTSVNSEP